MNGNNINNRNNNYNINNNGRERSQSDNRKRVDNAIDEAGGKALEKMGVPEGLAKKAIKSNGGALSVGNSPLSKVAKNKSRNALANGLSHLNKAFGSENNSDNPSSPRRLPRQNFGSNIVNNLPNVGSKKSNSQSRDSGLQNRLGKANNTHLPQTQAASNDLSLAERAAQGGKNVKDRHNPRKNKGNENHSSNNQSDSKKKVVSNSNIKKFLSDPVVKTLVKVFAPAMGGILLFLFVCALFIACFESFDLIGVGNGGQSGDLGAAVDDDSREMYQRIMDIEAEYNNASKNVSADKAGAVYHILNRHVDSFKPRDFTSSIIREVFDGSLNGNNYDREVFYNFLANDFFPKYAHVNKSAGEKYAKEVFSYLGNYSGLFDKNINNGNCSSSGSCTYDIKGFRINGNVYSFNQQVSNLKVRLMQSSYNGMGGIDGEPLPNEDLLDFEYYVMGVNYGEIGYSYPEEAQKAFQVIVRSFSLSRPTGMGNSLGTKLAQENGQWILQLRNSVADQVFCHPDKGCSMDVSSGQWSQVYSGVNNPVTHFSPIPADQTTIRNANSLTAGQVLVDGDGNIIHLGYVDVVQQGLKSKAEQGYDYVQIALEYGASYGAVDIKKYGCNGGGGSCPSSSVGDYALWKQYGESWSSVNVGNGGTIHDIGCLVTSIAIQIAKSGVNTGMSTFNPGTFVEGLNRVSAFSPGGALADYTSVSRVVSGFQYVNQQYLTGMSKSDKLNVIKNLLDQGYYPICEVMGNTGQHWVAIDRVEGDNVIMMDPGSEAVNLWSQYDWNNTSKVIYYKAS